MNHKFLQQFSLILAILLMTPLTIHGETNSIYMLNPLWNSDGQYIASTRATDFVIFGNVTFSSSKYLDIYDSSSMQVIRTFEAPIGIINRMAWNPVKDWLAIISAKNIYIWDVVNNQMIEELVLNSWVDSVDWFPNGDLLLINDWNEFSYTRIWNVNTGLIVSEFPSATLTSIDIAPDGQSYFANTGFSISQISSDNVTVNSSQTFGEFIKLFANTNRAYSSTLFAVNFYSSEVWIFDSTTISIVAELTANSYPSNQNNEPALFCLPLCQVFDARFSLDDTLVTAVSGDGTVRQWENGSFNLISETNIGHVRSASFSPSGLRLAILPNNETTVPQIFTPLTDSRTLRTVIDTCVEPGNQATVRSILSQELSQLSRQQLQLLQSYFSGSICEEDIEIILEPLLTLIPTATVTTTFTATFTATETATSTFTPTSTATFTPTATRTPTASPTTSGVCTFNVATSDTSGLISAMVSANALSSPSVICFYG
jgi:hypothetical protein